MPIEHSGVQVPGCFSSKPHIDMFIYFIYKHIGRPVHLRIRKEGSVP